MARSVCNPVFASIALLLAACNGSEAPDASTSPASGAAADANHKPLADVGIEYAMGAKQLLGKNLIGTIQAEGTVAAMRFCNQQALPLTRQMSTQYDARTKRVSDRPRNPANAANDAELAHIQRFKTAVANGEQLAPVVVSEGARHDFYYPIITNGMCLQCHGPVDKLEPDVRTALRELYPSDQAVGYDTNEVRGIWAIRFEQ